MSDRDTHLRLAEADTSPSPPGKFTITPQSLRQAVDVLKHYFKRNSYEIGTFQPTGIPTQVEVEAHKVCVAAARLNAESGGLFPGVEHGDAWKRGLRRGSSEEPPGLADLATHYAVKLTNCHRGIYPNRPQSGQRPQGDLALELSRRAVLERGGIGD